MPFYVYLAALAVAGSIPLLVWSLGGLRSDRPVATDRLEPQRTDLRQVVLAQRSSDRLVSPFVESLGARARSWTPRGASDRLERQINQAGFAGRISIDTVFVLKVALTAMFGGLGLVIWMVEPSRARVVYAVVVGALAWFVPDLVLYGRAKERQRRIGEELPEVLDQITVSVEAGLAFEAALARIVDEGGTAIAEEFGRALQDIRLGVSREAALLRVIERNDSPDLKHFVLALSQADRLGVPLANVLRVLADEMRERRRVLAQERAMKIPAKLVFPLVLCIMPALFVAILGPSIVRLFDRGLL